MLYLTDGPEKAHWLAGDERDWLVDRLRRERMVREAHGRHSLWEALAHPRPNAGVGREVDFYWATRLNIFTTWPKSPPVIWLMLSNRNTPNSPILA